MNFQKTQSGGGQEDRKGTKKFFLIFSLFLLLIMAMIAGLTILRRVGGNTAPDNSSLNTGAKQYRAESSVSGNNYSYGAENPKVTIVEFGDFACSYCLNSFYTIRKIGLGYQNDVKIIFRDYPGHNDSLNLALAARCAGEQSLFWPMHDRLFLNQGKFSSGSDLEALARSIGADEKKFSECMANQKYLKQIQNDFLDSEELGVVATPTWFINGYKLEGDAPYDAWKEIIESLIK